MDSLSDDDRKTVEAVLASQQNARYGVKSIQTSPFRRIALKELQCECHFVTVKYASCNDIYHYHDVARLEDQCGSECFDLTLSEIDENLEFESAEFRAWILSIPSVGDKFHGNGNGDIPLVQRIA